MHLHPHSSIIRVNFAEYLVVAYVTSRINPQHRLNQQKQASDFVAAFIEEYKNVPSLNCKIVFLEDWKYKERSYIDLRYKNKSRHVLILQVLDQKCFAGESDRTHESVLETLLTVRGDCVL